MYRLSRKVQDSYTAGELVLNILYTAEESCTERYGIMTNQHICFSDWMRFVYTCLGLICEIWMQRKNWIFKYCSVVQ